MQSEPVSPPPITTTCLPLARDGAAGAATASPSPAPRLFCWVRKSMAKWMPGSSRAGSRQVARLLPRRRTAPPRRSSPSSSSTATSVADLDAGAEGDALGLHLRHAAVDQVLLHLEVGDAVAQQAADAVALLEQGDLRGRRAPAAGRRRGRRGRSRPPPRAGRSGSAGTCGSIQPSRPAAVDDLALDGLDGHRVVVDVERAGRLAGRRADAAGELREVVGGVQGLQRRAPLVAVDQVVPVGDQVVDRAALVTERDAAVHAARGLALQLGRPAAGGRTRATSSAARPACHSRGRGARSPGSRSAFPSSLTSGRCRLFGRDGLGAPAARPPGPAARGGSPWASP